MRTVRSMRSGEAESESYEKGRTQMTFVVEQSPKSVRRASALAALALISVAALSASAEAEGKFTTFAVAGAPTTYVYGMNEEDKVTGNYVDSGGTNHGFLRTTAGSITKFDVAGSTGTFPASINTTVRLPAVTSTPTACRMASCERQMGQSYSSTLLAQPPHTA
jgi:hypothetical protein